MTRRTWMTGAAATALAAAPSETVRLPRKIKVAVLGFDGHTAEILTPLPQLPDVEIAAICDADPAVTARFGRSPRLASARRYTSYEEMLDREKLDMVAVCNNNGERAKAILACSSRKLHVIAEKPLAIERGDLELIRKAVARDGIGLSMLMGMRFSPPYLAVKKVVDSGEIG